MPTYNFRCEKCSKKNEEFFLPSKLDNYLKDNKCSKCKGNLVRDFEDQTMNFSMKTFKESNRRDAKFDKKVQDMNHTDNINKDPYYDVRNQ